MSSSSSYQQRMAAFQRASERMRFYKSIGRPDLAARYDPFNIPADMTVKEVKETKKGLNVTFQGKETQQSPGKNAEYERHLSFYSRFRRADLADKYEPFDIPKGMAVKELKETPDGLQIIFYDPQLAYKQHVQKEKSEAFFNELGYPQFGGKFAPFTVPKGMKVKTIAESDTGLQVSFFDPVAEQKSVEFFTGIGYSQFGGKYKPFEVPKGSHVDSVNESDAGLNVVFHDTESEIKQQQSVAFFTGIGFAQYGGKYQPFEIPKNSHVDSIAESNEGLNIVFHDSEAEVKQQKSIEFFTGIGYSQFAGKYSPFEVPEGAHIGEIKESDGQLNVVFHDTLGEVKQQAEIQKSVDFFNSIGYPAFAGKYSPFEVPEGAHIGELNEAEGNLSIVFHNTAAEETQLQIMEMENPQIAGISKGWQEYLNKSGLVQQAKYAQPNASKVNLAPSLPKSDYWTFMPSPSKPTSSMGNPEFLAMSGVKIEPPAGFMVTNLQPSKVEMVGPLLLGQTRPVIEAVTYELAPIQNKSVTPKSIMESASSQGFFNDLSSGLSKITLNLKQSLPGVGLKVGNLLTPQEKSAVKITGVATLAVLAPFAGPVLGIAAKDIIMNEMLGVGVNQTFKAAQGGGLLTPTEFIESAAISGGFSIASAGVFKGVTKVAPTVTASILGRMSVNAVLGASGGYVLSGGNLEETGKGALFGAVIGLGSEFLPKIPGIIKGKIYPKTTLTQSEMTIGASGKVPTWTGQPIEELAGKSLRVVADVTEFPVGAKGVSLNSLVDDYVGKTVPTSHATLTPENFNLKVGGETILKGFPQMSKGFRSSEQLYHFYSAPGSDDFVTIYGGYAGVGKGYSGSSKIVFGGKPTALVTLDTKVSPEFLKLPGESQTSFLSRISNLSGKTGLAPETLLGKSMERQLVTPAAYERFGVKLPGSKFVSEGKVGTFVIKTEPSGMLGKIPILKTIFADYQTLTVVKGKYVSTAVKSASKVLDVAKYNEAYGKTISVSSKFVASPSAIIKPIVSKNVSTVSKSSKVFSQQISIAPKAFSQQTSVAPKTFSQTSKASIIKQITIIPESFTSKSTKNTASSTSIVSKFATSSTSILKSESKSSFSKAASLPSLQSELKVSTSKANSSQIGSLSLPSSFSRSTQQKSSQSTSTSPSLFNSSSTSSFISPFSTPKRSKSAVSNPFIGGKGKGGKDGLKGKWRNYKNPIKTYDAMLRTVGINTPKGVKKTVNKADRSIQRVDKIGSSFFNQHRKTVRKKRGN